LSITGSKAISFGIFGAALIAAAIVTAPAQAAPITFNYDCAMVNATSCTPGGSFGTITLSESLADANRVDIDIVLNGPNILALNPNFTGLNNFYLNYGGVVPSNTTFRMVLKTDPAGSFNNNGGDVSVNFDNQGPLNSRLDFLLDPAGSAPSLTFSGSLALFSNASGHAQTNLDANMFDLVDPNSLLYSAFNTLPSNHTFNGGALTRVQTAIPEPLTLALFAAGLAGITLMRRRKAAKASCRSRSGATGQGGIQIATRQRQGRLTGHRTGI